MEELSGDSKQSEEREAANRSSELLLADSWKESAAIIYEFSRLSAPAVAERNVFAGSNQSSMQSAESKQLDQSANVDLLALQKMLETTHEEISCLHRSLKNSAFETEQARRSLLTNPAKIMTASSGLAILSKTPGLATTPLVGLAGLQGYDDFRNLLDSNTVMGRGKYALGIAADTALAAGSLGFLIENVPTRFKTPLLLGGLLGRVALDLLPKDGSLLNESEKNETENNAAENRNRRAAASR